nr:PREDICTED: synaptonemal complex protein 2 isoform X2 [Latimeria chalumnae]|eukprot:XP_014342472.1 PREDICTED: synaptonemal complex protein 2 isoform X2 [Latimeria chalumnae]
MKQHKLSFLHDFSHPTQVFKMPTRQELKFEKIIEDAARKNDFQTLEKFLQDDVHENISFKCTKQFINKLDKLINLELDTKEIKNVSLLLNCIQKYGKNITINEEGGLPAMIKQGLVQKISIKKSKEILVQGGREKDEALINLVEDFFDVLMTVHETNSDGKSQVLEFFLQRTGALVADFRLNIYIQQEAVRKLNAMLDQMSREARKKILSSQEMLLIMSDMGKRILDAGDYDLQVAITEALCRMTSEKQRWELADEWFSMEFVSNAFKTIKDSEFETDCRKFLNQVNGMLGERRSVFTYPCLEAFLDEHELLMPVDDKLEEFWIDFNVGSKSISFYIGAENNEEHQWETVSLPEDDIETYSVEEKDGKKLLTVLMKNALNIDSKGGTQIRIYFDSGLDILDVTRRLYGATKCKGYTRKQGISVVKTTVHIVFDETGSQVTVPETQTSLLPRKDVKLLDNGINTKQQAAFRSPRNQDKNPEMEPSVQSMMVTPSRKKISEASMIVPITGGLNTRSPPLTSLATSTPRKGRIKPPLEMITSAERRSMVVATELRKETRNAGMAKTQKPSVDKSIEKSAVNAAKCMLSAKNGSKNRSQNTKNWRSQDEGKQFHKKIPATKVVEMVQEDEDELETSEKQQSDKQVEIVPDSQPVWKNNKPLLPGLLESSLRQQKAIIKQQGHTSEVSIADLVFHDRIFKQQAFTSIFEEKSSPKQQRKSQYKGTQMVDKLPKEKQIKITPDAIGKEATSNRKSPTAHDENGNLNKQSIKMLNINKKETSTTYKTSPLKAVFQSKVHESYYSKKKSVSAKYTFDKVNYSVTNRNSGNRGESDKTLNTEVSLTDVTRSEVNTKTNEKYSSAISKEMVTKIAEKYSKMNKSATKVNYFSSLSSSYTENSWLSADKTAKVCESKKGKGERGSFGNSKAYATKEAKKRAVEPVDDIYSFNFSGADEPTIKLGVKDKDIPQQTRITAGLTNQMKNKGDKGKLDLTEKQGQKRTGAHHSKKHIFSDTDTDARPDDSKTDISWLRESNRKKPKVIEYSKQKTLKRPLSPDNCEKFELPAKPKSKFEEKKIAKKQDPVQQKTNDVPKQKPRSRNPRRTAAQKATYKELSDSEEESEKEILRSSPEREKSVSTSKVKEIATKMYSGEILGDLWNVPAKERPHGAPKQLQTIVKPKDMFGNRKFEFSPLPSPPSPLSIEKMRCAEDASVPGFINKCSSTVGSLSSSLSNSITEQKRPPKAVTGIKPSEFYKQKEKDQTVQLSQSSENSIVLSPLSLPCLTPVALEKPVLSEKKMEGIEPDLVIRDSQEDNINITRFHSKKYLLNSSSKAVTNQKAFTKGEETPSSTPDKSVMRLKKMPQCTIHVSGPTVRTSSALLKRMYGDDITSSCEDFDEDKEELQERRLQPRKLFKSNDDHCTSIADSEVLSSTTANDYSVMEIDTWETSNTNIGMVCQQFSKELTRKVRTRHRRIDCFTKHSLKSAQQHLTTMNIQIREYGLKRLEKFQLTITEELNNLEKDCQTLKNMEKELTNFWKQQSQAFSAYNENERQRIHHLKSSYEKNIYHSIEYEEKIFSSQMELMRKDMKSVQDKLLKEMQEEELHNVRKGLHSLFLAGATKY